MKIKINIQIFAITAILILTKQIEIYAWLMLFAFVHELAHIFTGLALKLKPRTLEIQPFGIGIIFESFNNTEKNKIIIALVGPITNMILAFIFNFINIKSQELIINSNILLAIFNLIPIYPLDGGRIIKAIITLKSNEEISEEIIHKISNILMISITMLTSILILLYKNIGLFLVIMYMWVIVIKENNRYNLRKRINKIINKNFNKIT